MTDVQDEQAAGTPPGPPSIFSADDSVEALWIKSYQGEILGEVLFGRIADQQGDPDRKHKMEMLALLERRTKEAIVPALERAGISTDADPETLQSAEALAEVSAALDWSDIVGSIEPITLQYLEMYTRIGQLDPTEQAAADLLVAHEKALREFGRRESAGDGTRSLQAIEALPHVG